MIEVQSGLTTLYSMQSPTEEKPPLEPPSSDSRFFAFVTIAFLVALAIAYLGIMKYGWGR